MTLPAPKTRWTYDEYRRMGDAGFFRDQRVELIDGEIIEMPPMKERHAAAVSLAFKAIFRAFGDSAWVRCQLPLHVDEDSEPEPDVSVVAGDERDYLTDGHPRTAILVLEVSDTSLAYDSDNKAALYARAGIPEFWIVDLINERLMVLRNPMKDSSTRPGIVTLQPLNLIAKTWLVFPPSMLR